MITYTYPWPDLAPTLKVPKLHDVQYNNAYTGGEIYRWCKENTRAPFYTAPSWTGKCLVQFEDDQDATMFALRFA
jgi:hypothetical protein